VKKFPWTVGKSETVKASRNQREQQLFTNGPQQVQYQSLGSNKIQQMTLGAKFHRLDDLVLLLKFVNLGIQTTFGVSIQDAGDGATVTTTQGGGTLCGGNTGNPCSK
jgi:hypothetical protein